LPGAEGVLKASFDGKHELVLTQSQQARRESRRAASNRVASSTSGVIECSQDAALADSALAARGDHLLQFSPERLQLADAAFHLVQVGAGNGIDFGTAQVGVLRETQKFTDLVYAEAEFAGVTDEPEAPRVFRTIDPVASG
jgi:hypothetical protein